MVGIVRYERMSWCWLGGGRRLPPAAPLPRPRLSCAVASHSCRMLCLNLPAVDSRCLDEVEREGVWLPLGVTPVVQEFPREAFQSCLQLFSHSCHQNKDTAVRVAQMFNTRQEGTSNPNKHQFKVVPPSRPPSPQLVRSSSPSPPWSNSLLHEKNVLLGLFRRKE